VGVGRGCHIGEDSRAEVQHQLQATRCRVRGTAIGQLRESGRATGGGEERRRVTADGGRGEEVVRAAAEGALAGGRQVNMLACTESIWLLRHKPASRTGYWRDWLPRC
jgi:hypothetical protein